MKQDRKIKCLNIKIENLLVSTLADKTLHKCMYVPRLLNILSDFILHCLCLLRIFYTFLSTKIKWIIEFQTVVSDEKSSILFVTFPKVFFANIFNNFSSFFLCVYVSYDFIVTGFDKCIVRFYPVILSLVLTGWALFWKKENLQIERERRCREKNRAERKGRIESNAERRMRQKERCRRERRNSE